MPVTRRALFGLPPADFTLWTRTWEYGRSRRIICYFYKALTGVGMSLLCVAFMAACTTLADGINVFAMARLLIIDHVGAVVGATLAAFTVGKITWHIEHWDDPIFATEAQINPLDYLFDGALTIAWALPFEPITVAFWHVVVLLCFWPWSSE